MRVEPYLMLGGRCEEALVFYQQAIDAKTTMLMRFDESPDKNHPMPLPPDWGQKIMHSSMTVGGVGIILGTGHLEQHTALNTVNSVESIISSWLVSIS